MDSLDKFASMTVKHEMHPEEKQAAGIQRRRAAEQARVERIFDVKNRIIGIDQTAIEAQIGQNQAKKDMERQREAQLDRAMVMAAHQTDILQQEVDKIKKANELEVAAYRAQHQQKTTRREYDLSDPDQIKNDVVPTDHPERLGLSSAQLFPGMDQTNDERKAHQAQQQREWVAAQISEKTAAKQKLAAADSNYVAQQTWIAQELNGLISTHEDAKKQALFRNAAENKALAAQRAAAKEAAAAADIQANERDINAAMTSSFLCEDPATTVSASNPNRPVPYHFKGLPTEYRQYVLDTQMQQAQAGQMKKQQESQSDQAFDQYFQQQNNEANKMYEAIEREKFRQKLELRDFQLQQAASCQARTAAELADLTSAPTQAYFDQFGTSSR